MINFLKYRPYDSEQTTTKILIESNLPDYAQFD